MLHRGVPHMRRAPAVVRTPRCAPPRTPRRGIATARERITPIRSAIHAHVHERQAPKIHSPRSVPPSLARIPSRSLPAIHSIPNPFPPSHSRRAPPHNSHIESLLSTKPSKSFADPTQVFPIVAALIIGFALSMLTSDNADAAEESKAPEPLEIERRASAYAAAGMSAEDIREQTTPYFRIPDVPPELTIAERLHDIFWASVETIRTFLRVCELSLRFAPLFAAIPLLFTRWSDLWYSLLLTTLRKSGPCFIKLGQWAATRHDIFPDELTSRLATLHTQAPFHTLAETREIIQRVFGRDVEELFDEFDPEPIASGAIAQVYRAKLKSGKFESTPLVLKVRHPGVAESIARDLRILRRTVQVMEWILGLSWLHPVETVDVFRGNMLAQVDLAVEATNLERFRANFAGVNSVRFPKPVRMLCRPEILVETYEEGKHISEFMNNAIDPRLRKSIASLGMDTYLKMMIEDSFTHADLHPGNILVDTRSSPPQLVILDCGLVVKLTQKDRRNFINLFSAVIEGDSQLAARLMTEDQPQLSSKSVRDFGTAIAHPIRQLASRGLAEINVSQVMGDILGAARRHRVRVDPAFTTLVVGTAVLEGLGRQLDPSINLISHATPFLRGEPVARKAFIRAQLNRGLFSK